MRKAPIFVLILLSGLLYLLTSGSPVEAAKKATKSSQSVQEQSQPAARAGDEVKTEFFSLKIPAGWIMPYPVNHKPDGTSAVFGDEKTHVTVTINAIQAPLKLKEFTDTVLPNMKKSGLKTGLPVMENGLYKVVIRGMPQGEAWFGSNGKLCTATVILNGTDNISAANELLGALKSPLPQLFPKKVK